MLPVIAWKRDEFREARAQHRSQRRGYRAKPANRQAGLDRDRNLESTQKPTGTAATEPELKRLRSPRRGNSGRTKNSLMKNGTAGNRCNHDPALQATENRLFRDLNCRARKNKKPLRRPLQFGWNANGHAMTLRHLPRMGIMP